MKAWLRNVIARARPPLASGAGTVVAENDPSQVNQAAASLNRDGLCHLQGVLNDQQVADVCCDFNDFVAATADEAGRHLLETQRYSRLCNLHLTSVAAAQAICQPFVMSVLERFFGAPAYVVLSLFFEQSSEQGIHRDTPFFFTRPRTMLAGVWFALEDISANARPLTYFPGGHRIEVEVPVVGTAEDIGAAWSRYNGAIAAACEQQKPGKKRGADYQG